LEQKVTREALQRVIWMEETMEERMNTLEATFLDTKITPWALHLGFA
jgi:hypothetical protein